MTRPKQLQTQPIALHPDYHDQAAVVWQWTEEQLRENFELSVRSSIQSRDTFPVKLHFMLENLSDVQTQQVIQWLPHGRAFKVLDKERFETELLPLYMKGQSKYSSFSRQLNIYGFKRLTGSHADRGAYYHEYLLRGLPLLSRSIPRLLVFDSSVRRVFDARSEPNFYQMDPLPCVHSFSEALVDHSDARNVRSVAAGDTLGEERVCMVEIPAHCLSSPCHVKSIAYESFAAYQANDCAWELLDTLSVDSTSIESGIDGYVSTEIMDDVSTFSASAVLDSVAREPPDLISINQPRGCISNTDAGSTVCCETTEHFDDQFDVDAAVETGVRSSRWFIPASGSPVDADAACPFEPISHLSSSSLQAVVYARYLFGYPAPSWRHEERADGTLNVRSPNVALRVESKADETVIRTSFDQLMMQKGSPV